MTIPTPSGHRGLAEPSHPVHVQSLRVHDADCDVGQVWSGVELAGNGWLIQSTGIQLVEAAMLSTQAVGVPDSAGCLAGADLPNGWSRKESLARSRGGGGWGGGTLETWVRQANWCECSRVQVLAGRRRLTTTFTVSRASGHREGSGEASVAACAGRDIAPRNPVVRSAEVVQVAEGSTLEPHW